MANHPRGSIRLSSFQEIREWIEDDPHTGRPVEATSEEMCQSKAKRAKRTFGWSLFPLANGNSYGTLELKKEVSNFLPN